MNIIESNKLIAEFMGMYQSEEDKCLVLPLGNDEYFIDLEDEDTFKFYNSWDWLMPVISKLKDVTEEPQELDELSETLWWGDIIDVYKEVIDCIQNFRKQN